MIKSFTEILVGFRSFYNDLLIIIGIVTALTISDVFLSKANLEVNVDYLNRYYDDVEIYRDFRKFNVQLPQTAIKKLRERKAVTAIDKGSGFSRQNPVDTSYLNYQFMNDSDPNLALKEALKYEYIEYKASATLLPTGLINNSEYWENEAVDILYSSLDSINLYKALCIILAHREVTQRIRVTNIGNMPAENIELIIETPHLPYPRMFTTSAEVTFLKLESKYAKMETNGTRAKITVDYLKAGDNLFMNLTTSLTNISKYNIYAHFETERALNFRRVLYIFIITLVAYYFIPLIFLLGKDLLTYFRSNIV